MTNPAGSRNAGLGLGCLWNKAIGVGVCGDWLLGPQIENAWRSGQQLGGEILKEAAVAQKNS